MGKKYLDIKENSLESSVYNILHGIQEKKIEEDEKLGIASNGLRVVGVEKCYKKYPFGIESKDDVYAVDIGLKMFFSVVVATYDRNVIVPVEIIFKLWSALLRSERSFNDLNGREVLKATFQNAKSQIQNMFLTNGASSATSDGVSPRASDWSITEMKASDWLIPEEDPGSLLGQGLPDAVQGPGVAPLGDIEAVRLHPGLDHVRGEDREPAENTCEPARPELFHFTRL